MSFTNEQIEAYKKPCDFLEICRTYDLDKIKEQIEKYSGNIPSWVLVNVCLTLKHTKDYDKRVTDVIDLLLEYKKVEIFESKEYLYQIDKGIYNDIYLDYVIKKMNLHIDY